MKMSADAENAPQLSSSGQMATSNLTREEVLALADRKKDVEAELEELYSVLASQGASMDEPLVDAQGYPRSDIDVYQVHEFLSNFCLTMVI